LRLVAVVLVVVVVLASVFLLPRTPRSRRLRILEDLSPEQKFKILESYLRDGVLEVDVGRVPVMLPLFREFETARRHILAPGARMSQFDRSCKGMFEDSLGMEGDFDKGSYADRERKYKVDYMPRERKKSGLQPVCFKTLRECDAWHGEGFDRGECREKSKLGCCFSSTVPDACACSYDGDEDLAGVLRRRGGDLKVNSKISRGFVIADESLTERLGNLYIEALEDLGLKGEERQRKMLGHIKNFAYLPPEGFLMWHTNRYDNDDVSYRIYFIASDGGRSSFKYLNERTGRVVDVPDFHGAVRIFTNTMKDVVNGEETYLWHTVVSETAHRLSMGWEIPPDQIVALLDSCEGCWATVLGKRAQ